MFELEELEVEADPGECWRFVVEDVVGVAAVVEVIFGSSVLASVSVTSFFSALAADSAAAGFEPSAASVGGRTSVAPTSLFTIRLRISKFQPVQKKSTLDKKKTFSGFKTRSFFTTCCSFSFD